MDAKNTGKAKIDNINTTCSRNNILPTPGSSLNTLTYNQNKKANHIRNRRLKINILYFNTQGLANEARIQKLNNALEGINVDVVCLAETRQMGENVIKNKNGDIWYKYGETKGHRAVGFLVGRKLTKRLIEFKGINERIALAKFKINKKAKHVILQIYAPTMAAAKDEVKQFYQTLNEHYIREQERVSLVMEDFNSKIGNEQEICGYTGPFRKGVSNRNGHKLGKFCMNQNLKIANSFLIPLII